jgi:hypothetical protein
MTRENERLAAQWWRHGECSPHHAYPSTKNKDNSRDPGMHQTQKSNSCYFGMKSVLSDGRWRINLLNLSFYCFPPRPILSKPTASETASESPKSGAPRHPLAREYDGARCVVANDRVVLGVLKAVFGLPYRALESFARSRIALMGVDFPVPDRTQMSRRARSLQVAIPLRERPGPVHRVVDSTALKIHGISEWKVRQPGAGKRRTWCKARLAVDGNEKDVISVEVITMEWSDGEVFEGLVDQVAGEIEQIDADGAYDNREAYDVAVVREAKLVVPPRENAIPWETGHPRNGALESIAEQGGAEWKQATGYHRRGLAENAMYRLKQLFGDRLASRLFETQVAEVRARLAAMNAMTYLGVPVSVRVGTATR